MCKPSLIKSSSAQALTPWPKSFQNLRSSRQTELTARFPLHVVWGWIDNSAPIADKHYLQITDDHYADVVTIATPTVRGTESGECLPLKR